jgi:hypothetical protein
MIQGANIRMKRTRTIHAAGTHQNHCNSKEGNQSRLSFHRKGSEGRRRQEDLKSIGQAGSLYIETKGIRLHEFHNWQSSRSLTGLREHPESPGLSRTFILIRQFQPDSGAIRRQYP